jgi:hypothetical protein
VRVELGGFERQVLAVEPSRQCLAISFATHAVIVELYVEKVPKGGKPHGRNSVRGRADYLVPSQHNPCPRRDALDHAP